MSLFFQDYQNKRINDLSSLGIQKSKRRRELRDDLNLLRPGMIFMEVLGKFGNEYPEKTRRTILNNLNTKAGFEHLNMGLLAATVVYINDYFDPKDEDKLTDNLKPSILDPYVEQGLSLLDVDYEKLDKNTKNMLYATIFRYIDWYFNVKSDKVIIEEMPEDAIKSPQQGEVDDEDEMDPFEEEEEEI